MNATPITEAHSISVASIIRIGPEHSWLNDMGRVPISPTTREALDAFQPAASSKAPSPRSSPRTRSPRRFGAAEAQDHLMVMNMWHAATRTFYRGGRYPGSRLIDDYEC
jgi:tryptophan synthase beta chain